MEEPQPTLTDLPELADQIAALTAAHSAGVMAQTDIIRALKAGEGYQARIINAIQTYAQQPERASIKYRHNDQFGMF